MADYDTSEPGSSWTSSESTKSSGLGRGILVLTNQVLLDHGVESNHLQGHPDRVDGATFVDTIFSQITGQPDSWGSIAADATQHMCDQDEDLQNRLNEGVEYLSGVSTNEKYHEDPRIQKMTMEKMKDLCDNYSTTLAGMITKKRMSKRDQAQLEAVGLKLAQHMNEMWSTGNHDASIASRLPDLYSFDGESESIGVSFKSFKRRTKKAFSKSKSATSRGLSSARRKAKRGVSGTKRFRRKQTGSLKMLTVGTSDRKYESLGSVVVPSFSREVGRGYPLMDINMQNTYFKHSMPKPMELNFRMNGMINDTHGITLNSRGNRNETSLEFALEDGNEQAPVLIYMSEPKGKDKQRVPRGYMYEWKFKKQIGFANTVHDEEGYPVFTGGDEFIFILKVEKDGSGRDPDSVFQFTGRKVLSRNKVVEYEMLDVKSGVNAFARLQFHAMDSKLYTRPDDSSSHSLTKPARRSEPVVEEFTTEPTVDGILEDFSDEYMDGYTELPIFDAAFARELVFDKHVQKDGYKEYRTTFDNDYHIFLVTKNTPDGATLKEWQDQGVYLIDGSQYFIMVLNRYAEGAEIVEVVYADAWNDEYAGRYLRGISAFRDSGTLTKTSAESIAAKWVRYDSIAQSEISARIGAKRTSSYRKLSKVYHLLTRIRVFFPKW